MFQVTDATFGHVPKQLKQANLLSFLRLSPWNFIHHLKREYIETVREDQIESF